MRPISPFGIARLPRIVFGAGTVETLPAEVVAFGRRVLVVTGSRSFRDSEHWQKLLQGFEAHGLSWETLSVEGEPSPELVDDAVSELKGARIEVVLGVGGGSALDAAKAVAGLLPVGDSVMEYLEGVGPERTYQGPALPFVAAPTTAGTGSEATKNAVLARRGPEGFKKSFRDEQLVARVAVIDPELLASCPRGVMAANGMDAFTQLLESFVSLRSNVMTDALAWSGMESFREGFFPALDGAGVEAAAGRSHLAYASLMSGVALAQTGLGSVHGLAPPLGSFFPISHGVACGTLVAEATDINIRALRERDPKNPALAKYARAGGLLTGVDLADRDEALEALVLVLRDWVERLALPRLGTLGVTLAHMEKIVANSRGSSMKTNPIVLTDGEVAEILSRRL